MSPSFWSGFEGAAVEVEELGLGRGGAPLTVTSPKSSRGAGIDIEIGQLDLVVDPAVSGQPAAGVFDVALHIRVDGARGL